jgi:heme-degrading monooxygenase HmoA
LTRGIASFHLVKERPGQGLAALAHLVLDRPPLHRTEGLRFFRLLGTGRGSTTSLSADPRRTALFAVWDDERALDHFLARSAMAERWAAAEERFTVRLRHLGGHGRWRGVEVLAGLEPGDPRGPVAVLTRADVRLRHWPRFLRAARPVSAAIQRAPGMLAVVGIGEAPLGRQATFSLWTSVAAATAFAEGEPAHAAVVRRTRAERWYGEELFARFEPYAATGTWSGRNPLDRAY